MGKQRCFGLATGVLLLFAALALGQVADSSSTGPAQSPDAGGDLTFALEEVSVFDLDEGLMELRMGQYDQCREAVDARATYPKLRSEHPLYGAVSFPRNPRPDAVGTYRYVLDESGGTGKGYDRLYLDVNRDGDLTNDQPLAAQSDAGPGRLLGYQGMQQVCFETARLDVPFDAQGSRPLEFMPRLMTLSSSTRLLAFVPTKARRGSIQLGGRAYEAILGHGYRIEGWFDHPNVNLHVIPAAEGSRRPMGRGYPLNYTQNINDSFYRFSATPAGDKLTVHPYTGPLGSLEVRVGDRDAGSIQIFGLLRSATTTVPVGAWADNRPLEPARSCRLPVGDYQLANLSVLAGAISGMVLPNYHLDGRPMGKIAGQNTYGIAIREDKPFVLEFSKQAQVLFALPARDQRVRPGEMLNVKAVLIDPALDVMYRLLRRDQGGQLDPKVVIKRAGGEMVAEGTMPFG
jgi:hypothetical protein